MPQRLAELTAWLTELGQRDARIAPASGDASFRRYFRVTSASASLIAMDAPPDREDVKTFARIASMFAGIGLNVPRVIAADYEHGFLLLSDLGTTPYIEALSDPGRVDTLYSAALDALLVLQRRGPRDDALPPYDRTLLLSEMGLFRDWYLTRHLGLDTGGARGRVLNDTFDLLADAALAQPRVCVHRDYHSRNLMDCPDNNPGILDFQDAVVGPLTYDLVSLLRDCYVVWPRARVEQWALGYREAVLAAGLDAGASAGEFLRWFDLMGVQRHLKAAGIFARLNYRDGKPGYLNDVPRTLAYVSDVVSRHAELQPLRDLFDNWIGPAGAAQVAGAAS